MAEQSSRERATAELAEDGAVPLVLLRGVTRRYPNGTVALSDVNLTIRPGERVAIMGRSGSGKSTLLNILGLLDSPTEGEVIIGGEHAERSGDRARSERRSSDLGFVFQRAHLIANLTVRENVLLGLRYSTAPPRSFDRSAESAIQAVGLSERSDALARTLSGGEMQRVAIARTLARPAPLWLADEPTGNLDETQSVHIIEELKERAAERNAALVVITHEPDIAARMDRVISLRDGKVVEDGPAPGAPPAGVPELTRRSSTPSTTMRARFARTLRFIAQGVSANPKRATSGVVAGALAVSLTVAAIGLAQSAAGQVNSMFDARRATQVTALLTVDPAIPPRWPVRIDEVEDFPGVTHVEYWHEHSEVRLANSATTELRTTVVSVDKAPAEATESTITWAPNDDEVLNAEEVVLGETLAERLGVAQLDLQPEILVAGRPLRVVGLLTASRSGTAVGSAFVSELFAEQLPVSATSVLYVTTAPGAARALADRLPALADPYGTTEMKVDPVLEPDAYRGQLEDSVSASLLVLAAVASLAGLVGVVFVNLLSVGSRTAEFGVRRALGARRSELVALVVGECTVLAMLGAGVGLAIGFLAIMTVTAFARWQPLFDPVLLVVPVVGALVFGLLGGVPPAVTASRIQPADAVRA